MKNLIQKLFFGFMLRPFLAIFIGLKVFGRDHLPKKHPFIIIANHSSHLDAAIILSLFSLGELKDIRPVAAADYFERNKIVSFLSHLLFNIICIQRKKITQHNNPIEILQDILDKEQSLLIFPEGTRSEDGHLTHFYSGITHLVEKRPEIPIVPIYLANTWRSLPKGEWLPVPFFCEVIIGKPLFLSGGKQEIVALLEKSVADLKNSFDIE